MLLKVGVIMDDEQYILLMVFLAYAVPVLCLTLFFSFLW